MSVSELGVGQSVTLNDGRSATVRFAGTTQFAPGEWVGVELDQAKGKNDGSVQGQRYFLCRPNYGMFVRPNTLAPAPKRVSGVAQKRQSTVDVGSLKRQSLNSASPTPSTRSTRIGSPNKGIRTSIALSHGRTSLASPASSKRSSMGPPPPPVSLPTRGSPATATETIPKDDDPGRASQLSSHLDAASVTSRSESMASEDSDMLRLHRTTLDRRKGDGTSRRETDELKSKLRVLERKRLEDRDKIKGLDKIKVERDRFEGIISKLQSKLQPQQHDLNEAKKELADVQANQRKMETQLSEAESLQEMVLLDKEMAEETAEALKSELDALRLKYEELELESNILKEENDEFSREISPEDRSSQGWLQLEKSNSRLRDALVRLRDVSQEQELQLQAQVAELEADVQQLDSTREELAQTVVNSNQAHATIDELRQQLELAQGSEEMIEELTEKNMSLKEKIEELHVVIEDLENLKELNDELELNRIENERQLQEEIDYNDNLLHEEVRKTAVQNGTIQDLEYTVARFRELVSNMQNDLANLQASKQISESEASELNSRSQAMMDLNQSLRSTAAKTQFKTIDHELVKLRADQMTDRLSMLSHFTPQSVTPDREGIDAVLRFRALRAKANILRGHIQDRSMTASQTEENRLVWPEIVSHLAWQASTFAQFDTMLSSCPVDDFRRIGAASQEVVSVERSFDLYIDSLQRDEFDIVACVEGLKRSTALLAHFSELHIPANQELYNARIVGAIDVLQARLDSSIRFLDDGQSPSQDREGLIAQIRKTRMISNRVHRAIESYISSATSPDVASISVLDELVDKSSLWAGETSVDKLELLCPELSRKLSSLLESVEDPSHRVKLEPNTTPWEESAQKLRGANADVAVREADYHRIKEETQSRATKLAIQDKLIEEQGVKLEVLEKRAGEAASQREKSRQLEQDVEAAKLREKDLVSKSIRLREEFEHLTHEHQKALASAILSKTAAGPEEDTISSAKMHVLLARISALESTIRYLQSTYQANVRTPQHKAYLSEPLGLPLPPRNIHGSTATSVQIETKAILKQLVQITAEARPLRLRVPERHERVKWRPMREKGSWQVQRQKEDWVAWKEWRHGLCLGIPRTTENQD